MPQNKIEIVEVKIQLDMEPEKPDVKLSEAAKVKLDELVNEQKVVVASIKKRNKKKKEDTENIKRVFSILKESFDRSIADSCTPEPISITKLKELYGSEVATSSLTAKIRSYLRKNYGDNLVLLKKQKNNKSAYYLTQYGPLNS